MSVPTFKSPTARFHLAMPVNDLPAARHFYR
jgi:extradiol dioxygenase family protein